MVLWLIDSHQKRHRLIDPSFKPCFYVKGPEGQLRRLSEMLAARLLARCAWVEKRNIWDGREIPVLEVRPRCPPLFAAAARCVRRSDPSLQLFNLDLMLAPLYCWQKAVFPFAKVEVDVVSSEYPDGRSQLVSRDITCSDSEWSLDFDIPPLRLMQVRLEGLAQVNPAHGRRGALEIQIGDLGGGQPFQAERSIMVEDSDEPLVATFERLLKAHDPDLILTEWGDSTLFPSLLRQARRHDIRLSLNRDHLPIQKSRPRSYMSYGRILFKESSTTLFGRLHVDTRNSFIADHCDLDGLWELVRVTKLPVQYASRTTTGTGISYMQMELAWRDGVLIPEQKAEPEGMKSPEELLVADRGGLVFVPRLGFFENVAELDFVSEYPSIMARFNVSPETVNCACCPDAPRVPELGYRICQRRKGITSRVVQKLIEKRQAYKQNAGEHPGQLSHYKVRRDALKWLLVCCFGYTGYKNARFGRIEAHEAINAIAREKLLVAVEMVEAQGYRVLHALVDSLYVQKPEATREDYQQLAQEIAACTELPLALDAVYRFVVFLPSRQDREIPVPNRFFAVADDGQPKIRGLECRRHDTPPLIVRMQREALAILAEARDFETYCVKLQEAREVYEQYVARLEENRLAPEDLVISKRLTRSPQDYQKNNATAIVARQLDRAGVRLRPGENVQYIICAQDSSLPDDRVRAWTLWEPWRGYDIRAYRAALKNAFEPFAYFVDGHRPQGFPLARERNSFPKRLMAV